MQRMVIYHDENVLKLCKITYIYIVNKCPRHCIVCKVSTVFIFFFG